MFATNRKFSCILIFSSPERTRPGPRNPLPTYCAVRGAAPAWVRIMRVSIIIYTLCRLPWVVRSDVHGVLLYIRGHKIYNVYTRNGVAKHCARLWDLKGDRKKWKKTMEKVTTVPAGCRHRWPQTRSRTHGTCDGGSGVSRANSLYDTGQPVRGVDSCVCVCVCARYVCVYVCVCVFHVEKYTICECVWICACVSERTSSVL